MRWALPQTDVGVSRWITRLSGGDLDRFIADSEYLLADAGPERSFGDFDADEASQMLVMATILRAARGWRDEQIEPLTTMRMSAPESFYARPL